MAEPLVRDAATSPSSTAASRRCDDVNLTDQARRDRRPSGRQRRRQVDADQGAVRRRALYLAARSSSRASRSRCRIDHRRHRQRDRDDLPGLGAGHRSCPSRATCSSGREPRTGPALPEPPGHGRDERGRGATCCSGSASPRTSRPRRPSASLSGGERQAVAIARAMHFDSDLIILDEPTNNLGVAETQGVLQLRPRARAIPAIPASSSPTTSTTSSRWWTGSW